MPPTYQRQEPVFIDINEIFRHPSHLSSEFLHQSNHNRNSSIPVTNTPSTGEFQETIEEEVDHLLVLSTILFPLLIGLSAIAAVALIVRRMRRSESMADNVEVAGISDRSFSSLPTPSSNWRESNLSSNKYSQSLPHLVGIDTPSHAISLPHLLAIETYYNYPSSASIMDETYQDVVDERKIRAEVQNSDETKQSRSLKRTLSMKSLRRLRTRILHILAFRKRRREVAETNRFNLYNLSGETRQQLKEIYVY